MKGLTLVELISVILILSIICAAIFSVLVICRRAWQIATTQLELQQNVRQAMERMARELNQSRASRINNVPADGVTYPNISFQIPEDIDSDGDILAADGSIEWGGQIQYSLGGSGNRQLLRTIDSDSTIWANNIISLQFRRYQITPNILEITLEAEKTNITGHIQQTQLNLQVSLRN